MPFMEAQRFVNGGRRLGQLPKVNRCAMAAPICFERRVCSVHSEEYSGNQSDREKDNRTV